jgi:putative molybdopterin biosynthesis protein
MAGFHTVQQPAPGSLAERTYKPLLKPGLHKIIGFARRTQGLMVARGNPLKLHTLRDLAGSGVHYVNRALGTGTRVLLDEMLKQQGVSATRIKGYRHTEPSHAAVAHAVAAGQADVGLGIEAAARARGLDFVPLVEEDYHLVCLKSALEEPAVQALCKVLRSADWQASLQLLPGYQTSRDAGRVLSLRGTLPWWNYRSIKAKAGVKVKGKATAGKAVDSGVEAGRRRKATLQSAQERKPQKMSSRPGRK